MIKKPYYKTGQLAPSWKVDICSAFAVPSHLFNDTGSSAKNAAKITWEQWHEQCTAFIRELDLLLTLEMIAYMNALRLAELVLQIEIMLMRAKMGLVGFSLN